MTAATKRSQKSGLPPGSMVYIGDELADHVTVTLIDYDEHSVREKNISDIAACANLSDSGSVSWINIEGLSDAALLEKLGSCFHIHPLILEDILNTQQRPKLDDMDDYLYVVAKMMDYHSAEQRIVNEQVSLIVSKHTVITVQEGKQGDIFNSVRERIRTGKGKLRKSGCDYLAYALLDCIIDNYFYVLEQLGERIEDLEDELIANPGKQTTMHEIHRLRRDMLQMRKAVWPLREVIAALEKGESELIEHSTQIYLRDIYDHVVQLIDTVETYREMLTSMLDIYLSSISNYMNQVMKVLTIIATIFIPLTFVAGLYGMNFKFMPELEWRWGYPAAIAIMLAIAAGMIVFFKRKKWL